MRIYGPAWQADFIQKVKLIKERLESRESETHGRWMTEEMLKHDKSYSAASVRSIIRYCQQFPESLVRPGPLPRLALSFQQK